ncbi:hypothetical protein F5Y01DRAFT_323252 [Xylaria sp. FL0043]|nr:hypothetical protein F5Y01DRAFT_323252 [Xylaria sp. FL0043]
MVGRNPNIEFPGPPYWLPLVPLARKYPGRHPLCQHAAGRPLNIVEASRCITSRCTEVFGLDMSPILSHLPPMARVVKYSTAPAFFVLGGMDDLQVSVEDYREITGLPAKRVKVVDLVRYECVHTKYEPVGPCQAILVKDNAIFDLIEEWAKYHPLSSRYWNFFCLHDDVRVELDGDLMRAEIVGRNGRNDPEPYEGPDSLEELRQMENRS